MKTKLVPFVVAIFIIAVLAAIGAYNLHASKKHEVSRPAPRPTSASSIPSHSSSTKPDPRS